MLELCGSNSVNSDDSGDDFMLLPVEAQADQAANKGIKLHCIIDDQAATLLLDLLQSVWLAGAVGLHTIDSLMYLVSCWISIHN